MKIKPMHNNVLIEVEYDVDKSGIILPEKEKKQVGKVVASGEETSVIAGQKVIFREFTGIDIEEDGKEYVMVTDEDVIAICEE